MNRIVRVTERDLLRSALPLVRRYWRLHRPGESRDYPYGPGRRLEPILDETREDVGNDWARLSSWAPRPIFFAPEVPVDRLHVRFPFARPHAVAGVVRLLTLHELAHHALGHCGLRTSLDAGSREELARAFETMEAEADALMRVFWADGLTPATVRPYRREVAV